MIVLRLKGGLGNQMFQYAAGRNLAQKQGVPLLLDISWYENDPKRTFELDRYNIKADLTKEPVDGALEDYYQNEKYFKDVGKEIRQEFTLKEDLPATALSIIHELKSSNSVAVHVRRGDYVSEVKTNAFHGTCPISHYAEAAKLISDKVDHPHFFIFSDDIDWARENLKLDYPMTFVSKPEYSAAEELIVMSHAKHFIIANSSFSWWAAWLGTHAGKFVIAPNRWFADEKANSEANIVPPSWIKLSVPRVSIVLPVYNGSKYMREAIDSMLEQTFKDFELIILNDGSTDNSLEIMRSYSDPRIRVVSNPKNLGLIATLNIGLNAARADLVARMDQDDISMPERLQVQYDYLQRHGAVAIVGSLADLIDKTGKQIGRVRKPLTNAAIRYELLFGNTHIHPSIMMRKEIMHKMGDYKELKNVEDYDLFSRVAEAEYEMANIERPLLKYRQHGESITNTDFSQTIMHENTRRKIRQNISNYLPVNDSEEKMIHDVILARHPDPGLKWAELIKAHQLHKHIYKSFIQKEKLDGADKVQVAKYFYGRRNLMFKKYFIGKIKKIWEKMAK